ncbi:MAG: membrane protein insertase YidC, partial [Proteobacteria bacterium]|nr:membrane protein insertase YidC [Pseudomonadota bacterium]
MDNQRIFLYGALFFVLFLIWDAWQKDHAPEQPAPSAVQRTTETTDRDLPEIEAPTGERTTEATESPERDETPAGGEPVRVVTDVLDLTLNTRGGDITHALLLEYPQSKETPDQPVELLTTEGQQLYVSQSGLRASGSTPAPNHNAIYQTAAREYRLQEGDDALTVSFTWGDTSGVEVEKRYTFRRGRYEMQMDFIVRNASGAEWRGDSYVQLKKRQGEQEYSFFNPSSYSYTGPAFYNGETYEKLDLSDITETALAETAPGGWAAMLQHYFLAAVIPPQDLQNRFYAAAVGPETYRVGYVQPAQLVPDGGETVFSNRLFIGPKLQERLVDVAPKLELAVDYGMLTIIAEPLFWVLDKIHTVVGNWGWAIILLTLLIKVVFYKLQETSGKSMARMRKMQPKLAALKERYADDREKLNKAMMELYQKEKINPFAGCLPILIQMPVFIALYWVLLESVELRQADWILWINDLSSPDPFYVLPVMMGLAMWGQQKLNPQPAD